VAALPDVAIITPYPRVGVRHGGDSGVASYSANLAHALTEIGVEPMVIAPHHDGEPAIATTAASRCIGCSPAVGPTPCRARSPRHVPPEPGWRICSTSCSCTADRPASPGWSLGWAPGRRADVLTMHQVVDPADVTPQFTRMHRIAVPAVVARNGLRALQHGLPRMADATIVHEPAFARIVPGARAVPHGIETAEPADAIERAAAAFGSACRPIAGGAVLSDSSRPTRAWRPRWTPRSSPATTCTWSWPAARTPASRRRTTTTRGGCAPLRGHGVVHRLRPR